MNIFDKKITNNCISGKCTKCGQCCTDFIPLKLKEVDTLKKYIAEHNIELTDWTEFNPTTGMYDIKMFCPLLEKGTNLCKAYEVRPNICKTFKCCKNPQIVYKERDAIAKSSKYNTLDKHSGYLTNVYSLYELLTGDKTKTIELLVSIAHKEDKVSLEKLHQLLKLFNREDITDEDILASVKTKKKEGDK